MMQIALHTHPGPRENLEDAAQAVVIQSSLPSPAEAAILVLADGVGGCNKGEVASRLAVQLILSHLMIQINALLLDPGSANPDKVLDILSQAIAEANQIICEQAHGECAGMATTIVCGVILGSILFVAWAGDSRMYRHHNGKLQRLTRDHSELQRRVDAGEIPACSASDYPFAHRIHRYLGDPERGQPEFHVSPLEPGNIIILCSDGLPDVLTDDQINNVIARYASEKDFSNLPVGLVTQALDHGTQDNVTVLCGRYQPQATFGSFSLGQTLTGVYPMAAAQAIRHIHTLTKGVFQ